MNTPAELYRKMALIREFEMRIDEMFATGRIRGTTHLSAGQEACAVGACAGLRSDDAVVSNHRGHGHFIAKGGDPGAMMAEMMGKQTGYSRGRGGSQHMACFDIGFLGSNGVTGGGLPVAVGAALGFKMQKTDRIVLCFFGDGASNQGTFHESLNLAAIWRLPIIFFCENNLYAMSTPMREATAVENIAERGGAYTIAGQIVDGNDVVVVKDAVAGAAERIRGGSGPALIEAMTYRYLGHSKSDKCEYRTREEEQYWHERDPIKLYAARLRESGELDDGRIAQIDAEVKQQVDEAVEFATMSPDPNPDELEGSVFA